MIEEKCTIVENRNLGGSYYLMKLEAPQVAGAAQAGNFVMVKTTSANDPLLKRPFGIFKVDSRNIWLYYEVVGTGTSLMADMKAGDRTTVLGPLGNAFPLLENRRILLVAGGRGIAPVFYAATEYTKNNAVWLLYGARSKKDLNLLDQIESLGLKETILYTDDGSAGKKGFITEEIGDIIREQNIDVTISCGPEAMFEALFEKIGHDGNENYVSMEAYMGCGFGVCHSCAAKGTDGEYKKVCKDGPVFRLEDIKWQ